MSLKDRLPFAKDGEALGPLSGSGNITELVSEYPVVMALLQRASCLLAYRFRPWLIRGRSLISQRPDSVSWTDVLCAKAITKTYHLYRYRRTLSEYASNCCGSRGCLST